MEIVWRMRNYAGFALFLLPLIGRFTWADPIRVPGCPVMSVKDCFLGTDDNSMCKIQSFHVSHAIEGDEGSLQRALQMIHKNKYDYVALLFYASWCPFSKTFRPTFSVLASLFPCIPHFAIEESAVRPSILSRYGVHGFPTLLLLNSTMRLQYRDSRSLDSLITFYGAVTGIETAAVDALSLDKIGWSRYQQNHNKEVETCPFPWARSPENLLQQETYLALATVFVILRLLYVFFPTLRACSQSAWRTCTDSMRLRSLWEHPVVYLHRFVHVLNSLNEPCRKSNLQEGAKNAKAWASKSLASVSFGDASSSRDVSVSSR